jgi:crotonobetainyl-CoA:carnitine CoA-transferase CaiB-like acyl-CoA transferase
MYAVQAILLALYERRGTGEGRAISVSLFDGMADWMTVPLLHHDYGGKAPGRVGLSHPTIAPYSAFVTRDGAIVISIQNEREWARFAAEILGDPALAREGRFTTNDSRVAHRDELEAMIAKRFAGETSAVMAAKLRAAGIAFGRVNSVAEVSRHPDLRRIRVATPTGPVETPAPPARFDGASADDIPKVPAPGEHAAALRAEFAK